MKLHGRTISGKLLAFGFVGTMRLLSNCVDLLFSRLLCTHLGFRGIFSHNIILGRGIDVFPLTLSNWEHVQFYSGIFGVTVPDPTYCGYMPMRYKVTQEIYEYEGIKSERLKNLGIWSIKTLHSIL